MTPEAAKGLRHGDLVYCQAPGRMFHNHRIRVHRVDSYDSGDVFVMGNLERPPQDMQEQYVFEPREIERLQ